MNFIRAKQELDAKYELKETLGIGAFSEVKKAITRDSGELVAIKIIDRQKCVGKENMIQSEINILKKVRHENIIKLYELFETEQKIYLVMELVTGGELFDSIVARGYYTEADAAHIVQKILQAVDYLHDMGIAHRDLKPENLLFHSTDEDSKIMISDFGLSKIFSDEEVMKTACGTPGYVAPEVLKRQGYGKEVDIWSLGVITYILLCGYPPFYHEKNQELFQLIMKGDFEFDSPHWDDISKEAKDFVSKCLVVNPRRRINVKEALVHGFITMYCDTDIHQPSECRIDNNASQDKPIPSENPKAANLAHRVSENLRTRGMSISRRRSVDTGKQTNIQKSNTPPRDAAIQEQDEDAPTYDQIVIRVDDSEMNPLSNKPDPVKKSDSGVLVESNKTSNDPIAPSSKVNEESNEETFLMELGEINKLLEDGKPLDAYIILQQVEMPLKLRKLYEDLIFLNQDFGANKESIQSHVDSSYKVEKPVIQQPSQDLIVKQLANLVKHSQTSMAIIQEKQDSMEILVQNDPSKEPAKSGKYKRVDNIFEQIMRTFAISDPAPIISMNSDMASAKVINVSEEVSFLSLNLFIRPPGIKNNRSDYKNDRILYFCEFIMPKYDVICLQDMFSFGSRRREVLLKKAKDIGLAYSVCSATPNEIGKMDGGLVILSRYPILKSSRFSFGKGHGADRYISRGALYAQIALGHPSNEITNIHVFNTSMQPVYDCSTFWMRDPSDPTIMARENQIRQLKTFIDSTVVENVSQFVVDEERNRVNHAPIILLGDFNVNSRVSVRDGSSHTEQYSVLKKIIEGAGIMAINNETLQNFAIEDACFEKFKEHPITFGNVHDFVNKIPAETVLSSKDLNGSCVCLTYIFYLKWEMSPEAKKKREQFGKFALVDPGSVCVEKFMTRPDTSERMNMMETGTAGEMIENAKKEDFTAIHSRNQMKETISNFKEAMSAASSDKNAVKSSLDSVASDVTLSSSDSSKKGTGMKGIIDQKLAAIANFFSPQGAHVKLSSDKFKFTQISDRYGLSMKMKLNLATDSMAASISNKPQI